MAEEEVSQEVEDQDNDPSVEVKEEFDKKLEAVQQTNEELRKQNESFSQQLNEIYQHLNSTVAQQQQANASSSDEDLEDLYYEDPKKYKEAIKKEAVEEAKKEIDQREQQQSQKTQVLADLATKYPEINDSDSQLTQKAIEKINSMDSNIQNTGYGYKLAVMEAADDLGVLPVAQRKNSNNNDEIDEYMGKGSQGGMRTADTKEGKNKKKEEELDPLIEETAKMYGIDTSKKENRDALIKYAKRKNWSKYQ